MINHYHTEDCLFCSVMDIYAYIDHIKDINLKLATQNVLLKRELEENREMDKIIKKIESKEKGALKDTKELLKTDKRQDKKMAACDKMMKGKKK